MSSQREPGMPAGKKKSADGSKWTKYQPKKAANPLSWDEVSAPLIGELVGAVTRDGAAILLGTTRDGGALVVTVCAGDERIKFYASTPEEVASMLANLIATAES